MTPSPKLTPDEKRIVKQIQRGADWLTVHRMLEARTGSRLYEYVSGNHLCYIIYKLTTNTKRKKRKATP